MCQPDEKQDHVLDALTPLALYGNRETFQRFATEGYTECSFGGGPWVELPYEDGSGICRCRLVGLFICYHPDPSMPVRTLETYKVDDLGGIRRSPSQEEARTQEDVDALLKKFQVSVSARASLNELLRA